jgi:hypothetical protein
MNYRPAIHYTRSPSSWRERVCTRAPHFSTLVITDEPEKVHETELEEEQRSDLTDIGCDAAERTKLACCTDYPATLYE